MKTKTCWLIMVVIAICGSVGGDVYAQSRKTIVLVRHVEKDVSPTADKGDPELSAEGRDRAERLAKAIRKYKPTEIFSTNYKRTRQTVEPLAGQRKKQIQIYDPAKPAELVEKIMASKTIHNLIVGHSNTIPALANLIAKKEIFRSLLESEYGVIWVIRMKKGVVRRVEIYSY